MAAIHALYDLCAMPEYIEPLRIEAEEALQAEPNGKWQFSTIKKLGKLDSFLKESLRMNAPVAANFNKRAMSDITLSNGDILPAGTFIEFAAEAMSLDSQYYPNAETFDGFRYYHESSTVDPSLESDANPQQKPSFTTLEPGNLAFGSGRHTCPGRWFAGAMMKLAFAKLLVEFDFRFPEGQVDRPQSLYDRGTIYPDRGQGLEFRRRIG